jgi:hypothetical protein
MQNQRGYFTLNVLTFKLVDTLSYGLCSLSRIQIIFPITKLHATTAILTNLQISASYRDVNEIPTLVKAQISYFGVVKSS